MLVARLSLSLKPDVCALGFAQQSERETISRMLSDDADANAIHYQRRHKLVFCLWFLPFEVDADSCIRGMGVCCDYRFRELARRHINKWQKAVSSEYETTNGRRRTYAKTR